jgi:hypothetical protein
MAKVMSPLFPDGIGDLKYRLANLKGFTHIAYFKNSLRRQKKKGILKK